MNDVVSAEVWVLRAAACELLALSFRYPTSELAEAVLSGEWAEAAEEVADALGVTLPEGFAAEARALLGMPCIVGPADGSLGSNDLDTVLHSLRVEATRLFVGTPEPVVSPYEGVWRAGDDGVQALLFVNPHSMAVERFCRACGLDHPKGTNEPLDHVATELELLQYLASLAAGITVPVEGGPLPDELPGGSPGAAYNWFVAEHASVWMPRFAEAVGEKARLSSYRAAAALLAGVAQRFS